jgi:hypothetical protein
VPQLVALVKGSSDSEAQLSREYGGTGGEDYAGGAVPLYTAIGNVRHLYCTSFQLQLQTAFVGCGPSKQAVPNGQYKTCLKTETR